MRKDDIRFNGKAATIEHHSARGRVTRNAGNFTRGSQLVTHEFWMWFAGVSIPLKIYGLVLALAYALNMHMAQGITADKGIAVMSSTESNLSNQRLFNVTVTRVRDDLTLYTDNKDRLTSAIERNEGNKTSALETVGQLEVDKAPQRQTSPSGQATPFNPTLPPDHDRKSMDLTHLRVAVEPRTPDLPFPEKDIGLEL